MLSRVVNWMIETKPIYGIMKLGAMNAMKSTTQKAGIDWDGHVRRMAATPEVGEAAADQHTPAAAFSYMRAEGAAARHTATRICTPGWGAWLHSKQHTPAGKPGETQLNTHTH